MVDRLPPILEVGGILISLDILTERFCCDYEKCRGVCCIEGDAGAPVTLDEIGGIEDALDTVWPDLSAQAQAVIDQQGVLLLNATLTVRAHQANSHSTLGWQQFTDAAIRALSEHREHLVYMLWGGYARSKAYMIDRQRNLVLESVHPSPLSANRGGWFGQHQFSRCNDYLTQNGIEPIQW